MMKKKILRILIIAAGVLLIFSGKALAAFDKDFLGTARYMGMCGAYVGMSDDEAAVFVNPAGLARSRSAGVALTGADMYAGLDAGSLFRGNLCGSINMAPVGAFGFGVDYFYAGIDDDVSYSETLFVISSARKILPGTMLGLNIKIPKWGSRLPGDDSYSSAAFVVSFDLGVLVIEDKNLSLGAAIYDLNQPYVSRSEGQGDVGRIPFSVKSGLSYRTLKQTLIINTDITYKEEYMDLLMGAELSFRDLAGSDALKKLVIRGGVLLHEFTTGIDFSLGAGYLLNFGSKGLRIDYAFKYSLSNISGDMGTHFLTTSFKFDTIGKPAPAMDEYLMDDIDEKDKKSDDSIDLEKELKELKGLEEE